MNYELRDIETGKLIDCNNLGGGQDVSTPPMGLDVFKDEDESSNEYWDH